MGWLAAFLLVIGGGFLASSYNQEPIDPLQATVIIEDSTGHGTGIFISPTQVLTAKHVTEHYGDEGMRIRGPEGDIYNIIGMRKGPADVAIFEVDRPLRVGSPMPVSCEPLKRGDKLSYYGNPMDIEFLGPVELTFIGGKSPMAMEEEPEMVDSTLLVEGEAEPGASGSGVIKDGKVVGVYNFAWNGTTFGGFVSLAYPTVCEWLMKELHHNVVGQEASDNLEGQTSSQDHL